MKRFWTTLVLLVVAASPLNAAWKIEKPSSGESFGTSTSIEAWGEGPDSGLTQTYQLKLQDSFAGGTTIASISGTTVAGTPQTWERRNRGAGQDNSLHPPSGGWGCGTRYLRLYDDDGTELGTGVDVNITDSGCQ
jgi:hypothetical protein